MVRGARCLACCREVGKCVGRVGRGAYASALYNDALHIPVPTAQGQIAGAGQATHPMAARVPATAGALVQHHSPARCRSWRPWICPTMALWVSAVPAHHARMLFRFGNSCLSLCRVRQRPCLLHPQVAHMSQTPAAPPQAPCRPGGPRCSRAWRASTWLATNCSRGPMRRRRSSAGPPRYRPPGPSHATRSRSPSWAPSCSTPGTTLSGESWASACSGQSGVFCTLCSPARQACRLQVLQPHAEGHTGQAPLVPNTTAAARLNSCPTPDCPLQQPPSHHS